MATSMKTIYTHLIIVNILANVISAQHEDYSHCCSIKVGEQRFDCASVTETKYCVPSVEDSTVVGSHAMTYLGQSFNYSTNTANVSWSQHIAETVAIQGYVVQLKEFSQNKLESEKTTVCYLVTFDESVRKGGQVLSVDCLPMPDFTAQMPVSVTVFAVAERSNTSFISPTNVVLQNKGPFPSLRDYNLSSVYHTQKHVLRVDFTPEKSHFNSLQLCNRTLGAPSRLWCQDVLPTETELYRAQPPLNGTYHLQMLPTKCSSSLPCFPPSRQRISEVDFSRKENFEIGCVREDYRSWEASVSIESSPHELSIRVTPIYQFNELACPLETFECTLYTVMGLHTCHNIDDVKSVKRISSTYLYYKSLTVIFSDLPPGNYCTRIKPVDPLCPKEGCRPRSCEVREVLGQVQPEDPHELPLQTTPPPLQPPLTVGAMIGIFVAVILGLLASFVCVLFYRRRKHAGRLHDVPLQPETPVQEVLQLVSEAPYRPRVLLLFCAEDDRLTKVIQSFADVLHYCFHLEVHMPNDINSICTRMTKSDGEWVIDTINEFDKIIFVSSTKALENAKGNFQDDSVDQELDHIFRSFYHNIISDAKLLLQYNYERLYVVRFSFTPSKYAFNKVVPNIHYEVPSSLPTLFTVIHHKLLEDLPLCDTKKLEDYWRQNSSEYNSLLRDISDEHKAMNSVCHQQYRSHPLTLLRHARSDASFCPSQGFIVEEKCSFLKEPPAGTDSHSLKSNSTDCSLQISEESSKISVSSDDSGYPKSISGTAAC